MNDFPIDLVVTYVDSRDPVWQNAIMPYLNNEDAVQRYRSWD